MIHDLYNAFHLGDSVFIMILFYNIKDYIETNNITINYYCKNEYHKQLKEFLCSDNIKLLDYKENGINVWIGNTEFELNYFNRNNISFNDFYIIFFNQLLKKININYELQYFQYTDHDLLIRYNNLDNKYKDIDFLIINSLPFSGQIEYIEEDWNKLCTELNKKYKIATTKKIDNILCTLDDNLSIKDIASLSTKVKKIVAVNTGVVPGLFNEYTLNNIKQFYYMDNNLRYSYPKFTKIHQVTDVFPLFEINNVVTEGFNICYSKFVKKIILSNTVLRDVLIILALLLILFKMYTLKI
jgi:hypothetical protein